MTVAELGRRMSSREFSEWMRYAELEPFGPLADGAAAAWLANVNRDPKKRTDPFTASEVLRTFAYDRQEVAPVDLGQKIRAVFDMLDAQQRAPRRVTRKPR